MIDSAAHRLIIALTLLTIPLTACAPAMLVESATGPASLRPGGGYTAADVTAPPSTERVTDHVIIISIDGLRPDAIERFGARTLQRLIRDGSHTLTARTITPSRTLPSHASMITGVEPADHGITWNDNQVAEHGLVKVPTIFSLARERGYHTAAFFSKGKFAHLLLPGSVDHAFLPRGDGKWLGGKVADAARSYLESERPNLLFVHFAEPDYAGHLLGWMSSPYGWAVRRADQAVGSILESAEKAFGNGNYTVIVTADHGGHGRTHGSTAESDMQIPWIVWGRGVRGGAVVAGPVDTTDTAATALWLLGVAEPASYSGRAVGSAFENAPAAGSRAAVESMHP
ncbi:MAG: ectonucleotide pyrophosphatase/phosphodiesterase [Gemmatimonadota bacterium]